MTGITKMKTSIKAQIVKSVLSQAGSGFCSVTFIKKTDGSVRTLNFNPKEGVKLVTGENSQSVETRKKNNPNLVNVVDAQIANRADDRRQGWRSFDAESVISLKVGGVEVKLD
jgi:hypothetical protein